jgi:hypothetical protein
MSSDPQQNAPTLSAANGKRKSKGVMPVNAIEK